MILGRRGAAILLTFLFAGFLSAEVVVLKGGTVISLKSPPVRRGDTVLLTRTDGTLLSVPASEIDREATASARAKEGPPPPAATPAPAPTLAGAARAAREVPRARVRITDADVSHGEAAAAEAEGTAAEGCRFLGRRRAGRGRRLLAGEIGRRARRARHPPQPGGDGRDERPHDRHRDRFEGPDDHVG